MADARISPAKLALAVKRLRAEREDLALLASEPIAVIGMGVRLPQAIDTTEKFWAALDEGKNLIGEIPVGRWSDAASLEPRLRRGGYLDAIDAFDAEFFGIAPREAAHIDPQQRLLLEVAWEALWDAGVDPASLSGAAMGVFASVYNNDYAKLHARDTANLTAHAGIGVSHSVASGRISYLLNTRGPSLTIDTACSSSLVGIHTACQSLRARECDLALVAAASLKTLSDEVVIFSRWGMLASDARCKTFDAAADGFVPGEGAGAVLLKRLADALADGDRIRAVVRGSAVNHDGRTTVLTAPSGLAQQQVLRAALANARIAPEEVSCIEAHGTGTSLGDPIELEALAEVYGRPQAEAGTCWLGAVKTNVGHLEAAAGVIGFLKTVLALEHEAMPRLLHFTRLNPQVSLEGTRLRVAAAAQPWKRGERARVAGISSFGLGGTNCHILVEESPRLPANTSVSARMIPLPPHRWQRQRLWIHTATVKPPAPQPKPEEPIHPLLGRSLTSPLVSGALYEAAWSTHTLPFLADHTLHGRPLIPFAAFLATAAAAVAAPSRSSDLVSLKMFTLGEPTWASDSPLRVQTRIQDGGVQIAIEDAGQWTTPASCEVGEAGKSSGHEALDAVRRRCSQPVEIDAVYARLERAGLTYGPSFRVLRSIARGDNELFAELELPAALRGDAAIAPIHPALLDGCLQVLGAALAKEASDLLLPLAADRIALSLRALAKLWVHVRVRASSATSLTADLCLWDADGNAAGEILGFTAKRTNGAALAGLRRDAARLVDALAWQAADRTSAAAPQLAGRWVLAEAVAESAAGLEQTLTAMGAICERLPLSRVAHGIDAAEDIAGFILDARSLTAPAAGTEWNYPDRLVIECLASLARRARSQSGSPARVVVLAPSACAVHPGEDVNLAQAALPGFVRTLALEHPEMQPVLMDAGPRAPLPGTATVVDRLVAEELTTPTEETIVAFRNGHRYVARLTHAQRVCEPQRLPTGVRGIDRLQLTAATRRAPQDEEVEITVRAAGLNFRDVLTALGMLTPRSETFGAECAGVITRVGRAVQNLSPGDAVLAFAPGSLQTFVTLPAAYVVRKPSAMLFADAAALPIAFLTAMYGLEHLAQLQAGQSVLIHAGAGGLGMAAIQIARRAGARIFATAGTEEKRALLRSMGVEAAFDSRTLAFREQVLEATSGRGVDVVLNSLAGEFLAASFAVTAAGGCFLEAGKRGIWSEAQVAALGRNLRYFPFDLGDVAVADPALIQSMLQTLIARFTADELCPLPVALYPLEEAVSAFRTMQQARHVGKIVLGVRPLAQDDATAPAFAGGTVLITGGLGALGRETARWAVMQGADRVVLAGRSAVAAADASLQDNALQNAVEVTPLDVSSRAQVDRLLDRLRSDASPLRAIVHAAGVVSDAVLANFSWESFEKVADPKIAGAWNLHGGSTTAPVPLTVYYASGAGIFGAAGQASYAAANTFLDGLAAHRAARGMTALAVDWGAWAQGGMAARLSPDMTARLVRRGNRPLPAEDALAALRHALTMRQPQVAILDADWNAMARDLPAAPAAMLQELTQAARTPAAQTVQSPAKVLAERLHAASGAERQEMLREQILQAARRALGLNATAPLSGSTPLQDLGLDSLMALEMRNELAEALGFPLPAGLLFDYPSVDELTKHLLHQLAPASPVAATPAEPSLASMSDDEAERLLQQELDRIDQEKTHA